jgi:hypothetical protein
VRLTTEAMGKVGRSSATSASARGQAVGEAPVTACGMGEAPDRGEPEHCAADRSIDHRGARPQEDVNLVEVGQPDLKNRAIGRVAFHGRASFPRQVALRLGKQVSLAQRAGRALGLSMSLCSHSPFLQLGACAERGARA